MKTTTFKKARLKLPGKMQVLAWAYTRSFDTDQSVRWHYQHLKEQLLKQALEQPGEDKDLVVTITENGISYPIHIGRR